MSGVEKEKRNQSNGFVRGVGIVQMCLFRLSAALEATYAAVGAGVCRWAAG